MVIIYSELFGEINIPEDKTAIENELEKCRRRFMHRTSRWLQFKIDCLEEALDKFRRVEEDV